MRAILMFHNCEGQSHRTMSTDHNFRRERRAEADSNRGPPAYQPNALPLGQTGSQSNTMVLCHLLYYAYQRAHMFSDCLFGGGGEEQIQLSNGHREFNWTRWRVGLNFSELPLEERDCLAFMLLNVHGGEMAY